MTEKRFTIELYKDFTEWYDRLTDNATGFPPNRYHWLVDKGEIIDLMNSLAEENEQLKKENDIAIDGLTLCQEKNAELKERNNRQAKTIHNLYSLMENKDWEGLTAIVEEMEEAEELNRMEFEAYCGGNDD